MKRYFFLLLFIYAASFNALAATGVNPLQDAIDNAPEGATVLLGDGLYAGPLTVNKSVILKGEGDNVIIKGNGKGSVINIIGASHTTVSNIKIEGSGESHESIDSCVSVKNSNNVRVMDNTMSDCLFGINFENVNRGQIERNKITSKPFSLGLKGDGIRLWYSHSNIIRANAMTLVRDMVFWYSSANRIEDNTIDNSRYSVHFMYADRNFIMNNTFENNSVGIFLMYSHGSRISNNKIVNSSGPFGIGIGFKEVSDCLVSNNLVMYNARGFYLDQSPYQPGTVNRFNDNKILYNTVGIQLHGILYGSIFENNRFEGNIDAMANDTPMAKLALNEWFKNYWDEYEGFDRNKDGYGDTPHEQLVFADKMLQYQPNMKFFYGSPVVGLLNFLSRLLPFSEPEVLAVDNEPRVKVRGEDYVN